MDDTLFLFYTRKADAPERILMSTVSLQGDWHEWSASSPVEILRPEAEYECIQFLIKPSKKKGGGIKVQQLRDPAIFHDDDNQSYLIYSVTGEMGLATAEISISRISL
jgi:beta-xylosidase